MGRREWQSDLIAIPFFRMKNAAFRLSRLPFSKIATRRFLDSGNMAFTQIPVYEEVEVPPDFPAPVTVAERLIEESTCRVIMKKCYCRVAWDCQDYDPSFGCVFIGEGAREISPEVCRPATVDEAIAQLHSALARGLVPFMGKFKGDGIGLGVKDHKHLMAICFCCPCCCVRTGLTHASQDLRESLIRKLPGLEVTVDPEKCAGCGTCVSACIFRQRTVVDGRAVIGDDCKGCGVCAARCPRGATHVSLAEPGYVDEIVEWLRSYADV
ncbi:MAG: 4Fe-4S binding protein [Actinobacteria bacterium]|nr:4Fe-4S binding protein [Actinomycetota bacterium]MBU1943974.1 4Fe-4S binding protein [Actinomycetota bacterium]MBU2686938.1 4Fe-4S binding protein [Actinomycetota bacterium]